MFLILRHHFSLREPKLPSNHTFAIMSGGGNSLAYPKRRQYALISQYTTVQTNNPDSCFCWSRSSHGFPLKSWWSLGLAHRREEKLAQPCLIVNCCNCVVCPLSESKENISPLQHIYVLSCPAGNPIATAFSLILRGFLLYNLKCLFQNWIEVNFYWLVKTSHWQRCHFTDTLLKGK